MKVDRFRLFLMRFWMLLRFCYASRADKPSFQFGRGCKVGARCSVKIGKKSVLRLGSKVTLRSGCVIDLAKEGELVVGEQAEIRHYAIIESAGRVSIGKRSVIGAYNWLQGSGEINIGNDVIIGPGVRIVSTTHDISNPNIPFACLPLINKSVSIGCNVWIGANVVILAGVCIGDNVVIGAGSVVTRDLGGGGVYFGVPAVRFKDVRSNL